MKTITLRFAVFFIFSFLPRASAQYALQSPYLSSPDKAIGYVDSCAIFWLKAYDQNLGGFFTNIDKYGNVITAYGTNKNTLTQARNAYGFVRAYMLTGKAAYLEMAQKGLDFMYHHAWDKMHGGWFESLDQRGDPISPFDIKTAFFQHYALLGISAYYEATADTTAWNWLRQGYNHLENRFWDGRSAYEGYYDLTDFDGANPRYKSFNATVDAITTHLLYLYLLTKDPIYQLRLENLARQIIDHLAASMDAQAIGFVEKYDSDWNWNHNERQTIMGHVLKAGWCLARIHQINPNPVYLATAEKLVLHVWQKGYDRQLGGPYKDYDRVSGQMLLWGNPDTTKAWWQMEQAVVAGLQLYDLTGDSLYLQMADETLDFFMKYFVDHENGEVYGDRTRYGEFAWNEDKGNAFKAGYHSIELGYYAYLYGKLFVKYEPATLHYHFIESGANRTILLTPLAIADAKLKIRQILKDGQIYDNYDPAKRTLTLPAGVSGHFEVTFERIKLPTLVENATKLPKPIVLHQNYPNPFNPATMIEFELPKAGRVTLKVYNIQGQEVRTLVDWFEPAGFKSVVWDGRSDAEQSMPSGVYIYRLKAGDFIETKRMILLK